MGKVQEGVFIAVDFDGTCVFHEYPHVGAEVPGAVQILKELAEKGHNLILYTMRCDKELEDAVQWFRERGITLYDVNHNMSQTSWTSSPKVYAQIYIDDAALGAPLLVPSCRKTRPYVDWDVVRKYLSCWGVL